MRKARRHSTTHYNTTYLLELELCAPADIGVGIESCDNATAYAGGIHLEGGF